METLEQLIEILKEDKKKAEKIQSSCLKEKNKEAIAFNKGVIITISTILYDIAEIKSTKST
jgi:RNA polymerase-interacting CarD/CdnL/TRCF family regulator